VQSQFPVSGVWQPLPTATRQSRAWWSAPAAARCCYCSPWWRAPGWGASPAGMELPQQARSPPQCTATASRPSISRKIRHLDAPSGAHHSSISSISSIAAICWLVSAPAIATKSSQFWNGRLASWLPAPLPSAVTDLTDLTPSRQPHACARSTSELKRRNVDALATRPRNVSPQCHGLASQSHRPRLHVAQRQNVPARAREINLDLDLTDNQPPRR
jgi:hypothetical protein